MCSIIRKKKIGLCATEVMEFCFVLERRIVQMIPVTWCVHFLGGTCPVVLACHCILYVVKV